MARIYQSIASATTTTLLTKGGSDSDGAPFRGGVSEIIIVNSDDSDFNVITLYLDDGDGGYPVMFKGVLPPQSSIVLDHNIYFDINIYNLKIITSSDAATTVMIYEQ
tara:strand:+ start:654 stop:974 length:321 start_codon:yes stop_codon:yes gene_type:complete